VLSRVVLRQWSPIEQDHPLRRLVEAKQQLDQRGLSRPVLTYQRQLRRRLDAQVDPPQHPGPIILVGLGRCLFQTGSRDRATGGVTGGRISEPDVSELESLAD